MSDCQYNPVCNRSCPHYEVCLNLEDLGYACHEHDVSTDPAPTSAPAFVAPAFNDDIPF